MNYFNKIGVSQDEVDQKIKKSYETIFFDPKEKFYFEVGDDMGYMLDTGNIDVRTEGMSYGMMIAVQMDNKDLFDRLWKFSKTYMWQEEGPNQGYFAWSVQPNGTKNSEGPAPDGEEYYALDLFFASRKWGDGTGIFNYSEQGKDILRHCVHQHEIVDGGHPMWEPSNYLIKFVPNCDFSDPSYHLPHFYELFAEYADPCDKEFWLTAAEKSREYLVKACHPVTGFASEYAEYDGTPRMLQPKGQYYSDSYRVIMNIALDTLWCGKNANLQKIANNIQVFFKEKTEFGKYYSYMIDGSIANLEAMHPTAIIATNAAGSIAAEGKYADYWIKAFWELELRKGDRRYYDNFLYLFCLMMLAGRYNKI